MTSNMTLQVAFGHDKSDLERQKMALAFVYKKAFV